MIERISDLFESSHPTTAGFGGTGQDADGTWFAVVNLTSELCLLGTGSSEGHALKALEGKCKALGILMGVAMAQAESPYQLVKRKEAKEEAEALGDLLSLMRGGPAPAKKDPAGGN